MQEARGDQTACLPTDATRNHRLRESQARESSYPFELKAQASHVANQTDSIEGVCLLRNMAGFWRPTARERALSLRLARSVVSKVSRHRVQWREAVAAATTPDELKEAKESQRRLRHDNFALLWSQSSFRGLGFFLREICSR